MDTKYALLLSPKVRVAIDDTYNYISHVLVNETAAQKTVAQLIKGFDQLLVFPEIGFNADECYSKQIHPDVMTRAIVIGKYIAFYFVNEANRTIYVSHFLVTKVIM